MHMENIKYCKKKTALVTYIEEKDQTRTKPNRNLTIFNWREPTEQSLSSCSVFWMSLLGNTCKRACAKNNNKLNTSYHTYKCLTSMWKVLFFSYMWAYYCLLISLLYFEKDLKWSRWSYHFSCICIIECLFEYDCHCKY